MKYYLLLVALLTLVPTPFIPIPAIAEETRLVASKIVPELKKYARSISVKVATDNTNSGSGVIIGKQGDEYLIITNNHVVRDGTTSIQTADGTNHKASIVSNPITSDDDIALLSFKSSNDYRTAERNSADTGKEEKGIYAVGYSAETGEFIIEWGKIERIGDRPFKEGYQIGYTSNIVSGMSGGAIFDYHGDIVGINGIGAFPILDTPYQYEDETTPAAAEIEQFRALSWGLSLHRLLTQLNPEIISAYDLPQPETVAELGKAELTGWLGDLETKAKQITVRIDSSSGANGSGVIVAKEGNTYTVLTAAHVLCEKNDETNECIGHTYEIITPDAEKSPLNANTINAQPGVDSAVFKFESDETYQVAELADYPIQDNDAVFVAGYPKLDSSKPPQWQFSLGFGLEKERGLLNVNVNNNSSSTESSDLATTQSDLASGYEMVYTSTTYGGMSGGAVLDKDGRVIGIHGLAEGETVFNSQSGREQEKIIQLGYSLGVPIRTFIGLKDRLGINATLLIQENQPQALNSKERNELTNAILGTEFSDSNTTAEGWLERGNNLWRLKRYEEAERAFDRAIDLEPGFIHLAYYGRGLALAYQAKFLEALASLEKATRIKPNFESAFFYKGIVLLESNRWDEALAAIESAITLQPKNANSFYQKGLILSKLERYPEAETAYSQAINLNARSFFYNNRGNLYLEQGKTELAFADYTQAIQINPQITSYYINRGNLYAQQGEIDLALSDYSQAIQINPQFADAYNNRGNLYAKGGATGLALANYNQALKLNPQSADAYNNRGFLYQNIREIDLALSDYSQAIQINPQFADAYNNRGFLYQNIREIDLALSDYNQALKLNPQSADAYNNRGNLYAQQGGEKELALLALVDYNQALKLNPHSADAYNNRGSLYAQQGETDLARADYNQALKLNPQFADAYITRGSLYAQQGETDLARADYNQALKLNPQSADAYNNRGNLYLEQGEIDLALADYNQALKLNPQDAGVYNNRGNLYRKREATESALADYNKALKLNPQFADAYNNRGSLYAQQGATESALADYNKALKLNPQFADAYITRGVLYQNLGEIDSALSDYNQALELNPQSAIAYNNRGLLYQNLGEIELALSDYNQALELNPQYAGAYNNRGLLYEQMGDEKAAIANLQKAQQLLIDRNNFAGAEQVANILKTLE